MAWPPPVLPINRTNADPQQDTHPNDHNALALAMNDTTVKLTEVDVKVVALSSPYKAINFGSLFIRPRISNGLGPREVLAVPVPPQPGLTNILIAASVWLGSDTATATGGVFARSAQGDSNNIGPISSPGPSVYVAVPLNVARSVPAGVVGDFGIWIDVTAVTGGNPYIACDVTWTQFANTGL